MCHLAYKFCCKIPYIVLIVLLSALTSCSRSNNDVVVDDPPCDAATDANGCEEPPLQPAVDVKATAEKNQPFSKFQLGDALYTNNVYDYRERVQGDPNQLFWYQGVQDSVSWFVPTAAALNDTADTCGIAHGDDPIQLSYRLTAEKDSDTRDTFVRAYPAMVVGTMGGRFESWGVECNNSTVLDASILRDGNSPLYDMTPVKQASGFPTLAADLPDSVKVSVKADIRSAEAATGIANVFLDSYWHDVSTVSKVPGQNAAYLNTINGINADVTEVWNLNVWFDWPRVSGSVSDWTGGFKLGSVVFSGNSEFDVYFKAEGSRSGYLPNCRTGTADNCFLYIALVTTEPSGAVDGITIDYREIADWMRSSDFRDLILSGVDQSDPTQANAKAYEIWRTIDGTENDSQPDPANRGPRFPDLEHVIGGLHLGSELWYNPDAELATITFESMGIRVDGISDFGRYIEYP